MSHPKFERLEVMVKQYEQGFSCMQIAKYHGICEERARELLKKYGVQMRKRGAYVRKDRPHL
jgi:hypothetical protein